MLYLCICLRYSASFIKYKFMASIKLILRHNKLDKSGDAPLYIRVIKDRKTKFISLGVKLNPKVWDEDKQIVKKKHTNSTRLNAFLSQKVADAQGEVADLERNNISKQDIALLTSLEKIVFLAKIPLFGILTYLCLSFLL